MNNLTELITIPKGTIKGHAEAKKALAKSLYLFISKQAHPCFQSVRKIQKKFPFSIALGVGNGLLINPYVELSSK